MTKISCAFFCLSALLLLTPAVTATATSFGSTSVPLAAATAGNQQPLPPMAAEEQTRVNYIYYAEKSLNRKYSVDPNFALFRNESLHWLHTDTKSGMVCGEVCVDGKNTK